MASPIYDRVALAGPSLAEWDRLATWSQGQLAAGRTALGNDVDFPPERAITCRSCGVTVEYRGDRRCPRCGREL